MNEIGDKLLELLVQAKILDAETSKLLKEEAAAERRGIEELIYAKNLAPEEEVAKAKAKVLGMPYRKIDQASLDPNVLKLIPYDTARTYRVFPISKTKDLLVVGAASPEDVRVQDALRFIAKQQKVNLGVYLVTPSLVEDVLRRYSPLEDEIKAAIQTLNIRAREGSYPGVSVQRSTVLLEGDRTVVAGEAPIIKIVARFLKEAVAVKASDVHFEPLHDRLRVRFRIDGRLEEVSSVPIEIHPPVISRLKILSKLKIDENRIPQDGRFRTEIFGRDVDFRVATFPTPFGEKIELRVLDPSIGLKGLSELGIVGRNLAMIEEGIKRPYGLILITGPTGSGKTTTMYALMQILNRGDVNIVSLEDPVEYSILGVNQSQVQPEIGYTFASGLRQILRQDPDVIMIGEIRDNETAELATHAALTGHIVLSSLHTNNSLGVIPRMTDLGVQPFLLPSTVNLMMAQRLVGRLCEYCKKPADPSPEVVAILKKELDFLPKELKLAVPSKLAVYRASGCPRCKGKGMVGRIALVEVFRMTPQLGEVIATGINENRIVEEAKRQGMITLRQDGILKALSGVVSIEEVLRETSELVI